ncbi:MAG: colicin E3/pyocin S6 family cytotoxin [Alphaproteobacteria bacterium]
MPVTQQDVISDGSGVNCSGDRMREPAMAETGTGRIRRPFPRGDTLPGFPDAYKVGAKTPRPGGGQRSGCETADGAHFERDPLHDAVEVHDPTGRRHPGEGRSARADPTRSGRMSINCRAGEA